jgi:hypothetical protein
MSCCVNPGEETEIGADLQGSRIKASDAKTEELCGNLKC